MSIEIEAPPAGASALAPAHEPTRVALWQNRRLFAAIIWTVFLLALILAPERMIPIENSTEVRHPRIRFDLIAHFILFVGFAVTWMRATRGRLRWLLVPAIGLVLAIGTEWVQGFEVIHRDPSLSDALADCAGLAVGLIPAVLTARAGPLPPAQGA